MKPIPRVVWPTEPAPAKEGREKDVALPQEAVARRGRSIDSLRKQLHDLVETLSARDLDKVTAFAEFVKARRAARGFAQREAATEGTSGESDPEATPAPMTPPAPAQSAEPEPPSGDTEADTDEEATPSSRKRPAAR